MRALDLFSGIGLFSRGLHQAGVQTVAACEKQEWKRLIFRELVGDMPIWPDVLTLSGQEVVERAGSIDLVFGSPPCTDASSANTKGRGIDGPETGLFMEAVRIVREIRPRWIVFENVPPLRTRGADRVLCALEEADYATWPLVVGADNAGAPHIRKRVWIVGLHRNADGKPTAEGRELQTARRCQAPEDGEPSGVPARRRNARKGANADEDRVREQPGRRSGASGAGEAFAAKPNDADSNGNRRQHAGGRGLGGDLSVAQTVPADGDSQSERGLPIGEAADNASPGEPYSDAADCDGRPDAADIHARAWPAQEPKLNGRACWQGLAPGHGVQLAALERDIGPAIHEWAGGLGRYLRLADGCPAATARMLMSACGDGVVETVAEEIGKAIMQADQGVML